MHVYHILKCIYSISHLGCGIGPFSNSLYQVHLELVNQSDCDSLLNNYFDFYPNIFHPELMICAGDIVNAGRSVCDAGNQHTRMNVKKYQNTEMRAISDQNSISFFTFFCTLGNFSCPVNMAYYGI